MLTAKDVTAEIMRPRLGRFGRTQIMKILYYAQGWNLAWTGKPLFADAIEAWDMGPVVKTVWAELKHDNRVTFAAYPGPEDAAVIGAVTNYYGRYSASQLVEMTHNEAPWITAYQPSPLTGLSTMNIEESEMRKYFSRRSLLRNDGPKRPASPEVFSPSTRDVRSRARVAIDRWQGALDLLERS